MKIKAPVITVMLLALIVSVFNICYTVYDCYFDNIKVLPYGEFLYSSLSPDGEITVSVYKVETPVGDAIRGAVVSIDESGVKNEQNIFWELNSDNALVGWADNTTVIINDKFIDISENETFDSRYCLNVDETFNASDK